MQDVQSNNLIEIGLVLTKFWRKTKAMFIDLGGPVALAWTKQWSGNRLACRAYNAHISPDGNVLCVRTRRSKHTCMHQCMYCASSHIFANMLTQYRQTRTDVVDTNGHIHAAMHTHGITHGIAYAPTHTHSIHAHTKIVFECF